MSSPQAAQALSALSHRVQASGGCQPPDALHARTTPRALPPVSRDPFGKRAALARRIPICIIPDLKRRCHGDLENLRTLPLPTRNVDRIVLVVTSSLSIPFLSVGFGLLILQTEMPDQRWMLKASFSLLLAGALGAIAAVGLVSSHIAATPAKAWPDYR